MGSYSSASTSSTPERPTTRTSRSSRSISRTRLIPMRRTSARVKASVRSGQEGSDSTSATTEAKKPRRSGTRPQRSWWLFRKCSSSRSDEKGERLWPHTRQTG